MKNEKNLEEDKSKKNCKVNLNLEKNTKLDTVFHVITAITMLAMLLMFYKGYKLGIFTSQEKLDSFIVSLGFWGPLSFVIIQIVQVVIPVIPGGVTSIAGVFIFGPVKGTLYNYVGIVTGSYINYFLARKYGVAFVEKLIGKKKLQRYTKWLHKGNKFDRFFSIAMAVPISPDDILCLFAGLVNMKLSKFTFAILFLKPWSLIAYTFGGDFLIKKMLLNW
ncbi:Uncharacterized membrane protein YdjX, TVP38/TMEM64 family, SNARE-associated domain [Peptoniphilus asaccharolyticus DSM 20463]|uniref:TVP38/TMEM64 family membrane protein n=1 Tax=Peptoniphilus asaccharolyticus DSM 20463 TaxID=573058 RepID=A0A1W1VJY7_PEPAS|nr:TVP38/TMEM64 family protein [Peptoniphilus asaccharolyticus]MBL7574366.1 TVP38/TMEM64 family protein [Peptoniphilus asaccharolyticus]SMB93254.1 Uncharacterized membrane protein YdjX, TVP38/TMEM64 family, SNARE-associated domain [Peptoniphilus asaccharolyticus DSM 20463]